MPWVKGAVLAFNRTLSIHAGDPVIPRIAGRLYCRDASRPADSGAATRARLLLRRHSRNVAGQRQMWPDVPSSCTDSS